MSIHDIGPDYLVLEYIEGAWLSAAVRGPVTWSVMGVELLNAILREFREGLEQIYAERLVRLVLFGSQARNDAKADSDIDVMVVLRGAVRAGEEIERTSFLKADICVKHGVLVSCVYISDDRFRQEQSPLMLNVRREGILV